MTILQTAALLLCVAVWTVIVLAYRKPAPAKEHTPGIRAMFIIGWLYLLVPSFLQVAVNGRVEGKFTLAGQGAFSGPAVPVGMALQLLFLASLAFVLISTLGRKPPAQVGGLVLASLLPWLLMAALAYQFDQRLVPVALIYPLVMVILSRAQPRLDEFATIGRLTIATAVFSLLLGLATDFGTFVTGPLADKAILGSTTLGGPFPHSNTLGVVLTLGLPTVFLVERRWLRIAGSLLVILAITWTASRTSMIAVGVLLLTMLAMRATRRSADWQRFGAVVALLGLLVAIVWIPATTTSVDAFTQRGRVWLTTLARWENHHWLGSGPDAFSVKDFYTQSLQGAFYGHNLYVQSLATGGWVMLVLTGLLVLVACRCAVVALPHNKVSLYVMVTFLSSSLLEVPISFWLPGPQSVVCWFVLALVLFGRTQVPAEEESGPAAETADAEAGQPGVMSTV